MKPSVQDIAHYVLDVRPLIRGGVEPFNAIMEAVDGLAPGQSLQLIAPFKPAPLFSVMERKGFSAKAEPLENGDWQVLFCPVTDAKRELQFSQNVVSPEVWPEPSRYLDCSDMQPPEPMVRILAEVEAMPVGAVLFALLHREPLFLFPELEKRGHAWVGNLDETGNAYRIMIRVAEPR